MRISRTITYLSSVLLLTACEQSNSAVSHECTPVFSTTTSTPFAQADFNNESIPFWVELGPSAALTEKNTYEGSHNIRGNLNENVFDEDIKTYGLGLTSRIYIKLDNIVNNREKYYVEYMFRLDDCHWKGDDFTNPYYGEFVMKLAYLISGDHPSNSFYLAGNDGQTLRLAANNDKWLEESKQNLWGSRVKTFESVRTLASNGNWNKFGYYFDKSKDTPTLQIFINDILLKNDDSESIPLPSDFSLDLLQVPYVGNSVLNQSTDKTGVCNGWQIDSIKLYDNLPK